MPINDNESSATTPDPCECETRHPLERDGTGQSQRLLPALDPAYVKPDERRIEDMLLFARKFAQKLRFFNNDNEPDGDWLTFIENDVTMLVAEISKLNLYEERKKLQARIETMEQDLAKDEDAEIEEGLPQVIIEHIAALIKKLNSWYIRSDKDLRLYHDINLTFTSVFVPNIRRIAGVIKAALAKWSDPGESPITYNFSDFEDLLNDEWIEYLKRPEIFGDDGSGNIDWENDTTVPPLNAVFEVDGNEKQLYRSASRYLHGLYEQQANALQTFAVKKEQYLTETLEKYPYHKAHIGLYLAFLRVFTYAQQHLNGLTARHLDYYYESVLGLKRKAAEPDKVHVIFVLAKNVTEFLVAEGTGLNASKDKKGMQVVFDTCDDLLVNTSKATTFKNLLVESDLTGASQDTDFYSIYASPVANSSDGIGGELDTDVPQWEAFGESQYGMISKNRTMPDARVGFALASPQLFAAEGERTLTLVLPVESNINGLEGMLEAYKPKDAEPEDWSETKKVLIADAFTPRLTGKKGWFSPAADIEVSFEKSDNPFVTEETWGVRPGRGETIYDKSLGEANVNYGVLDNYYDFSNAGLISGNKPFNKPRILAEESAETVVSSGSSKSYYALRFVIRLNATEQAIVAYNPEKHKGTYTTTNPILVIELPDYSITPADPEEEDDDKLNAALELEARHRRNIYRLLKKVQISKGKIMMNVRGVKNVIVQNDAATLKPDSPFSPFGISPSVNSSFYIGSDEVFSKKLNKLDIYAAWHEKPDDFDAYYAVYKTIYNIDHTDDLPATLSYTANAEIRYDRQWKKLKITPDGTNSVDLFGNLETGDTTDTDRYNHSKISFTGGASTEPIKDNETRFFGRDTTLSGQALTAFTNDVQRGFIRLVLQSPDFFHKAYPAVLARVAFETAKAPGATRNGAIADQTVNPPYTPIIRSITVDYESDQSFEAGVDQLFHLYPFGEAEVIPEKTGSYLLPQFRYYDQTVDTATGKTSTKLNETEQQALLFIGLENAKPGTSISMLVQMVENSGSPDVSPPDVNWSYLRNNTWIKLNQQQLISDTTNGFLTSGIVELALPNDATDTNTILDSGKYWLAASVAEGYDALSSVLGIYTQAVCAVFEDNGNDPSRLSAPLESAQIAKLLNSLPQVKKVTQPYASFGGRMAEQSPEYYRRVSERLRHKGRSMAIWDYEHLVLEYFPSIYKVKCISHTSNVCDSELIPGSVCVTVISNLRNQNQVDTLKPTTSIAVLEEIKTFLQKRTSRFVNLEVINPKFEEVKVAFDVVFYDEYAADNGYYTNLLEEEIKRYLSPWAFDDGAEIVFGGTIHGSSIINFIEERSYVSYIRNFVMQVLDENGNPLADTNGTDIDDVKASTAKSVLVSSDAHSINWIQI